MNVITLVGRLARDPELRYTPSGKAVVNFTIAVQRNKDEVDWIDCVAWERTAETIHQYRKKGDEVAVNGRLQIRNWETTDGQKRKSAEVQVSQVRFIGSRRMDGHDDGAVNEELPF